MTNKTELSNVDGLTDSLETESGVPGTSDSGKKTFVEPELSSPVSVLEATRFFQVADSGGLP